MVDPAVINIKIVVDNPFLSSSLLLFELCGLIEISIVSVIFV